MERASQPARQVTMRQRGSLQLLPHRGQDPPQLKTAAQPRWLLRSNMQLALFPNLLRQSDAEIANQARFHAEMARLQASTYSARLRPGFRQQLKGRVGCGAVQEQFGTIRCWQAENESGPVCRLKAHDDCATGFEPMEILRTLRRQTTPEDGWRAPELNSTRAGTSRHRIFCLPGWVARW